MVNLLENDIVQILAKNYQVSVGYNLSRDLKDYNLNANIRQTSNLLPNSIKNVVSLPLLVENTVAEKGKFYRTSNDEVFVCLFVPDNYIALIPKHNYTEKVYNNIVSDDNYIWRKVADVVEVIDDDLCTVKLVDDTIRNGVVYHLEFDKEKYSNVNSGNTVEIHLDNGNGLNILPIFERDILTNLSVQNGGSGYRDGDIAFISFEKHNGEVAQVDVYVENGQVKLEKFTNGSGYDYIDIIIIGDGENANATFNSMGGVLTNVEIDGGSGYTWAKAFVVHTEKFVTATVKTEPLNGFNNELRHNKYFVIAELTGIKDEINFYGLHRKQDGYKDFVKVNYIDEFKPEIDEILELKLVIG